MSYREKAIPWPLAVIWTPDDQRIAEDLWCEIEFRLPHRPDGWPSFTPFPGFAPLIVPSPDLAGVRAWFEPLLRADRVDLDTGWAALVAPYPDVPRTPSYAGLAALVLAVVVAHWPATPEEQHLAAVTVRLHQCSDGQIHVASTESPRLPARLPH